jgi:hypothetical protein
VTATVSGGQLAVVGTVGTIASPSNVAAYGFVDPANSSTVTLAANATMTGTFVPILGWAAVTMEVKSDVVSAVSGWRAQFSPDFFPPGTTPEAVLTALWNRATARESKGVLLLTMDLARRAWSGSARAKAFYDEQQRLWVTLLSKFLPDQATVEHVLQVFQGAVFAYLIARDPAPGKRALMRALASQPATEKRNRKGNEQQPAGG